MSRHRCMPLLECLEQRTLMSVSAGPLLVALPPLASNSFLTSQFGSIAQIQLGANDGPSEGLSLQATSNLDLTASEPSAGLAQQYFAQLPPVPTALPTSASNAPANSLPAGD